MNFLNYIKFLNEIQYQNQASPEAKGFSIGLNQIEGSKKLKIIRKILWIIKYDGKSPITKEQLKTAYTVFSRISDEVGKEYVNFLTKDKNESNSLVELLKKESFIINNIVTITDFYIQSKNKAALEKLLSLVYLERETKYNIIEMVKSGKLNTAKKLFQSKTDYLNRAAINYIKGIEFLFKF